MTLIGDGGCRVRCHSILLHQAMPYAMFLASDSKSDTILLPGLSLPELKALVTFIYSGGSW